MQSKTSGQVSKRNFITDRPVAVLMVFIAALVFGYFSLWGLPVTLMPELSYPTITVRTEYPGAAPEEVENDISRPVEEALGVVSGLKEISSISRAGVSDVVLRFVWGTDVSEATQATLERLDRVRLPNQAERPLILHFDPALDPVLELSLSGEGKQFQGEDGLRRLRRIAELQIKRALEPAPGVAAVRIRGGLEEEIHVLINENKLKRSGLSIQTVINRLRQENINVAGGKVIEGGTEYMVRTLNEFQDLEQMRETIISYVDDRPVRIGEIAEVKMAFKEREILTTTDGEESVQIDIYKEADANMVALAKSIHQLVGELPASRSRSGPPSGTRNMSREEMRAAMRGRGDGGPGRGGRRGGGGPGGGRGGGGPGGSTDSGGGMSGLSVNSFKRLFSKRPAAAKRGIAAFIFQNEGAKLQIVADRSTFIESSISEVKQTAMLGGLLAIMVLYMFLRNFKSTAIIAVSIPMSILITFAPMHLSGISLNIMSLGGLALGIGMLVDSSIVVLESIYRCREEGDSVRSAAIRGVSEVRGAVFASVLTSIAVFFPMVFVEGIAGQAFSDLGIAVVISLLASFVVAVSFIPMLASRTGIKIQADSSQLSAGSKQEKNGLIAQFVKRHFSSIFIFVSAIKNLPLWAYLLLLPIVYLFLRFLVMFVLEMVKMLALAIFIILGFIFGKLIFPVGNFLFKWIAYLPLQACKYFLELMQTLYLPVLRWSINNTFFIYGVVLLCFISIYWAGMRLQTELLPEVYQGEFTMEVQLPVGTPIQETYSILDDVEQAILEEKGAIKNLLVTYGYDVANSQNSDEGEHTAKFKVILNENDNQKATEALVVARLREYFADIPDAAIRVIRPVLFSETTPVEVEIYGKDLDYLKTKTIAVKNALAELPELADVESSLRKGAPEIQVVYDRDKMIKYNLNIGDVAESVRDMVKGFEATRFNKIDRRIPIVVKLDSEDREAIEDIRQLTVNPRSDIPIPLYAVAELVVGEGPSEVRRIDGNRAGLINANLGRDSLSNAAAAIRATLEQDFDWNDGTTFSITGQNEEWESSKGSLYLALGLSIFLVYVIMAAQFESLLHPFIIMFSIPLAFVGTFAGLLLLNVNLSIVVVLGMIMLAGLVVNNAIVFVDYINKLRINGLALQEAILRAGEVRLRPILMTTATTILGLLPMALGLGDGAEIRTPMAIAVVTGLLSSTFLTLLIIPSIYASIERVKERYFFSPQVQET